MSIRCSNPKCRRSSNIIFLGDGQFQCLHCETIFKPRKIRCSHCKSSNTFYYSSYKTSDGYLRARYKCRDCSKTFVANPKIKETKKRKPKRKKDTPIKARIQAYMKEIHHVLSNYEIGHTYFYTDDTDNVLNTFVLKSKESDNIETTMQFYANLNTTEEISKYLARAKTIYTTQYPERILSILALLLLPVLNERFLEQFTQRLKQNIFIRPDDSYIDNIQTYVMENFLLLPNGAFIAFKILCKNDENKYVSCYDQKTEHKPYNPVVVEDFDANPNNLCSRGLHIAGIMYLKEFKTFANGNVLCAVYVEPEDIVALTLDTNTQKMRVRKYIPIYMREQSENTNDIEEALRALVMDVIKQTSS